MDSQAKLTDLLLCCACIQPVWRIRYIKIIIKLTLLTSFRMGTSSFINDKKSKRGLNSLQICSESTRKCLKSSGLPWTIFHLWVRDTEEHFGDNQHTPGRMWKSCRTKCFTDFTNSSWVCLDTGFAGRTLTRRRRQGLENYAAERMEKAGNGSPSMSAHRWVHLDL